MAHMHRPACKEASLSAAHTATSATPTAPNTSPKKVLRKFKYESDVMSGSISPDALYFDTRGRQNKKRPLAHFGNHSHSAKKNVSMEEKRGNAESHGSCFVEHL